MADIEEDRLDLENWLKLYPTKISKELTIVSVDDSSKGAMLHIDIAKTSPKKFFPMLSRRAADSEDNTVPRVTVSNTLLGCLIGYSNIYFDFHYDKAVGYAINGLPFRHCLRPSPKLVWDAEDTGEYWLVNYNRESREYVPIRLGSFFVITLGYKRKINRKGNLESRVSRSELAIEVKQTIPLHGDKELTPGHYLVTYELDIELEMSVRDKNDVKIKKISSSEFNALLSTHAVGLTLEHRPSLIELW